MINRFALSFLCIALYRDKTCGVMLVYILLPDIVLSVLSADSKSSKWTKAHLCQWPSVHLAIPLSRYLFGHSRTVVHTYTHNVVRASCVEMISASVESRKRFLYGSLCLARLWSGCIESSSWRQRSALLATFRRMWGGAIPARAYNIQAGYWGSL